MNFWQDANVFNLNCDGEPIDVDGDQEVLHNAAAAGAPVVPAVSAIPPAVPERQLPVLAPAMPPAVPGTTEHCTYGDVGFLGDRGEPIDVDEEGLHDAAAAVLQQYAVIPPAVPVQPK
ncbi:hypothetical protein OS493_035795 [Desmophyllum pertusum]|uniref:Uncharacterized protein n=1 Tax=Desmophyllum pertusum TaxID=174260 RepID=A0A9W9YJT4_9CNID|nr:hypothetical protein OS493_035795 [Desmophyllum pertusum]